MTGGLRSVARMSCAEFAGSLDPYVPGDVPSTKNIYFMPTIAILRAVFIHFSLHLEQRLQPGWECSEGSLTLTTLWTSNTEEKYMGRTAMDWGSAAAHNLAAYSQSELGFATHFNMYLEVQLPAPNGSLGHTRGQVNCAMARSKALTNAVMPVYFVWNKKSRISNGTAKAVGSHNVSNTRSSVSSTTMAQSRPKARRAARLRCLRDGKSELVDEHALVPLPRRGLAAEAPRRRQRHGTRDATAQRTSSATTGACAGSVSAPSATRSPSAAYAAPTPCSCSTQGTCCRCMVRPPLWRRRPARAPPCPPELRLVCRQHTKLNCDWVGLVSGTCASCTAPVAQRAGKARRSRSSRAPPAAAHPAPAPCHLGVTSGQ
jgi:hypothetical protein